MLFKEFLWDSKFFGFGVGQVYGDLVKDNLPEIYEEMAAKNIRLAYYSSQTEILFPTHPLYRAQLMDVKVTYLKDIACATCDEHVQPYTKDFPEEKLISLAVEAGVYSRFKKDTAIPLSKYEEMYRQWIVNSVNRKIADEVLVYETSEGIAGFVTLGTKDNRADIGLIAVDKQSRRCGVASALMTCSENYLADTYKMIQVVTQKDNNAACNLYERCGYMQEKTAYIYHIWKQ